MVKQNIFHGKEHEGKENLFFVLFVTFVVPSLTSRGAGAFSMNFH
ncbi:hypothetical protein [Endozoicomonas sp. ONNA2]|nr:hypothetical protein [Endozoicomonas sp. ONNA2]